jgi:hypothetical protein
LEALGDGGRRKPDPPAEFGEAQPGSAVTPGSTSAASARGNGQDRADGVVQQPLCDAAEQESGECRVPAGPNDDHIGQDIGGGVGDRVRRAAADDRDHTQVALQARIGELGGLGRDFSRRSGSSA